MPYAIKTSNGTLLTTISDQSFDTVSSPLTLVGKGSVNYGPAFTENFVFLMENFADNVPPNLPLIGQLWFDTSSSFLKYYVGNGVWNSLSSTGGIGTTSTLPQGMTLAGNVSSGNRIAGSTGVALTLGTKNTTVCLNLSEGKIVSIISAETIPAAMLPALVKLEGNSFNVASRFPYGIFAGTTLATDTAGYLNSGLATSSLFADIAERYRANGIFSSGDVVSLGGEYEVCLSSKEMDTNVYGVVSTNPAVVMNHMAGPNSTHPAIALVGRVPCKIVGKCKKFDVIVSSHIPGVARAFSPTGLYDKNAIVGRALEDKETYGVELIEIVLRK